MATILIKLLPFILETLAKIIEERLAAGTPAKAPLSTEHAAAVKTAVLAIGPDADTAEGFIAKLDA